MLQSSQQSQIKPSSYTLPVAGGTQASSESGIAVVPSSSRMPNVSVGGATGANPLLLQQRQTTLVPWEDVTQSVTLSKTLGQEITSFCRPVKQQGDVNAYLPDGKKGFRIAYCTPVADGGKPHAKVHLFFPEVGLEERILKKVNVKNTVGPNGEVTAAGKLDLSQLSSDEIKTFKEYLTSIAGKLYLFDGEAKKIYQCVIAFEEGSKCSFSVLNEPFEFAGEKSTCKRASLIPVESLTKYQTADGQVFIDFSTVLNANAYKELSSQLHGLIAQVHQNFEDFEHRVRCLENDAAENKKQTQTTQLQAEENKDEVGTLKTEMSQCTKALTQLNGLVNEIGLKVDILTVRSTNGTLVWKITEVEKRTEEAKTGKTLSLYSPPFFTSQHGYRMCLRLYLNGDGQGKGSHISLFIVMMKSDYDDLLSWPFKHKVTLSLLNQSDPNNSKAHQAKAFRPTDTSSSFHKPRGPFNTASGFPKFVSVDTLRDRNYVRDDSLFIKVKIDMSDMEAPDHPV